MVACVVLLAAMVFYDRLTIQAIRETAHPNVHRARGVVDVFKPSRHSSLFRLSQPGAEPLLFKCLRQVVATPRCPTPSQDWTPREMTVEWIAIPSLLPALNAARATRMAMGDDPLFDASPRAVQEAEIANLTSSIPEICRVFGGLMLVGAVIAALLFGRLWFLTRQIEAAHRRARAGQGTLDQA